MLRRTFFASCLALGASLALTACSFPDEVASASSAATLQNVGAVSAADPRAEEAGYEILRQGGNATDAAVAVMLALTVVEPQSSGIGGGGFYVHANAAGEVTSLDGRETAPIAAGPDWFLDENGAVKSFGEVVSTGLSIGVPGNIALAAKAHERHGKLSWKALFQPAIRLAREGFRVTPRLHNSLDRERSRAKNDPASLALFYTADGEPVAIGSTITVPELADTLEAIANKGPKAFYEGDTAAAMAGKIWEATPGARGMTASDIENYQAKQREPVCSTYRGYKICGMGPPSSGGIAVSQMLGQLERFDLAALGPNSPKAWHLLLETQRLAYADRALYAADSDYVAVPVSGLIDRAYMAQRSALIDPDKAMDNAEPGTPPAATLSYGIGEHWPENGTSHFVATDADGNIVSYTSTIEGAFGAGIMFGGFYLNNELTDFSLAPTSDGKPVANRVEGGKRPRSSMAPTIVFDPAGEPFLAIGAAGGGTIPVQVMRGIVGVIDFGLPLDEALGLPIIMQFGNRAVIEQGSFLEAMQEELKAMGHENVVAFSPPLKANAAKWDGQRWITASDPRLIDQVKLP